MTTALQGKRQRKTLFLLATFGLGVVFGVVLMLRQEIGALAVPISFACAVGSMLCTLGYFANMDELAQRAHYVAWFWGATVGLCVLAVGIMYVVATGMDLTAAIGPLAERYWGGADVRGGFAADVTIALGLQLIGAALWWAGYWLRQR